MKDFIKINENDNVIVAIKELAEGEKVTVDGEEYTAEIGRASCRERV